MEPQAKQKIKRVVAAIAGLFSGFMGRRSIILNYHSIHPNNEFSTTPTDFERQMVYVKEHFEVISLSCLVQSRVANQKRDIMAITFDDGYEDNYVNAFPVLQKLGLPATIFLTSGFLDRQVDITTRHIHYRGLKPLTWIQVREMLKHGVEFGSHTHTHPILTKCSLEDAEREIIHSKEIIEGKLNESVELFAYPFGQPNTFNRSIIGLLKKRGFKSACSALWGHVNSNTDAYALPRIRIDACDTLSDFKDKVYGNWDFIRWIQLLKG